MSPGTRKRTRLCGAAVATVAALLAVPAAASATVTSSFSAGELTVSSDAGDPITIICDTGNVKVNTADPGAVVACSAVTKITVNGGPQGNAINLTGVTRQAFTALTSVAVDGKEGDDLVTGSEFPDTLDGMDGNDRIVGFRNGLGTRDVMIGGNGDDTLVWNPGDDDDTMDGEAGNDTIEVNGGNGGEEFEVKPSPIAGRVQFDRLGPTPPGPFNLDIGTAEKLDFNANGGNDTLNANGAVGGLDPFAFDADGGAGNDLIATGDAADILTGALGNDRLVAGGNPDGTRDRMSGGEGDDTLVWNPGDDDDTMDGEAGNDTIEVNGGNVGEEFEVQPSATAGRVRFDRLAPTPPGPFNLDIGTAEKLQLNANGGDDEITGRKGLAGLISSTLNGGNGNDRIKGTDGEDLISGGNGHDLVRSRDGAEDQVECDAGFDLALVDQRDRVRACEIVLGGRLRVLHAGKSVSVTGGGAALTLRCVATRGCKGKARLVRGGKSLGAKRFNIGRRKAKTIRIQLNGRARRLMANGPGNGVKVRLHIDARDAAGNGWRTTKRLKLKG